MRILRHFYFTPLITAAFIFFSAGAQAKDTEEAISFYPSAPWEISEIKPVDDFSGECAIQAEFNNGFILQFNGSSNWIQLLSLNIRQDAFEVDQNYSVNLTIPGIKNETIIAKAYEKNIISIPLKGKKEFYKTLRDNGVLDMDIEGNTFRFVLTNFTSSAKEFEYCMAGMGGSAEAMPSSSDDDLSVSTKDMDEAEKGYLLNEAQDFEAQELEVYEAPALDADLDTDLEEGLLLPEIPAVPAIEPQSMDSSSLPSSSLPSLDDDPNSFENRTGLNDSNAVIHKTTTSGAADLTPYGDNLQTADTAALAYIAQLENRLQDTQAELDTALQEGAQERKSISSENWNLERVTKRYNEAELQMKKLGQQLQKERALCSVEKKELELMLFDPKLTSQAQLAHLSSLEQQLAEAQQVIAQMSAQ